MILESFMSFFGVIAGGVITWLASRHFYFKSGQELKNEAHLLFEQTQLILTAMEQAGLVELRRKDGRIVGFERLIVRTKSIDDSGLGVPKIASQ